MKKISIEGNICSGKTLYLKLLEKEGYHVHYESSIDPLLLNSPYYFEQLLYNYSHPFGTDNEIHLFENSPYTLKNVYGDHSFEQNNFCVSNSSISNNYNKNLEIWQRRIDYDVSYLDWKPDAIIYLFCQPFICHERQQNRNHQQLGGQSPPSYEQIINLHIKYEIFCNEINCPIPIYKINSQDDIEIVFNSIKNIINNWRDKVPP